MGDNAESAHGGARLVKFASSLAGVAVLAFVLGVSVGAKEGANERLTAGKGDPYTVFLQAEDAKIFEENVNGNFEGVGMEIGMRGGLLTIISPLKGTPAERAGLHAGDGILAIDGEPTDGLSVDEA